MPLSFAQRDELIDAALLAFSGDHGTLIHGFRVSNSKGQAAAIYWSALAPGNEVEVAVAPARISEKYGLDFVQGWLAQVQTENPARCESHEHGDNWPIVGGSLTFAMRFLRECRDIRRGFLDARRQQQIEIAMRARSPQDLLVAQLESEREALRPTRPYAVIDLVRRAGISVKDWYTRGDGSAARAPRSNPAYCYNWAFGGGAEPALACVWHQSLLIVENAIECHGNLQADAIELEMIAMDRQRPDDHRERARTQATRARRLDELLAQSAAANRPMRVIINEGYMRPAAEVGAERSVVRVRHLDDRAWEVISYGDSGNFVMRRQRSGGGPARLIEPPPEIKFADQHDLPGSDEPNRKPTAGSAYKRDRKVRLAVLERAQGHCELCDAPGFAMEDGRLYLETHHVVPLAEHGADRSTNVIALCPSHHREAHYGARAGTLRKELLDLLDVFSGKPLETF